MNDESHPPDDAATSPTRRTTGAGDRSGSPADAACASGPRRLTVDLRGSRRFGLLCLATTCVGWGLNWPAMKRLLMELPPLFARGSAGLAAALLFAVAALALGQSLRVRRDLVCRLVAASLVNVFAWMGLSTLAMQWLKVGQAALLVYTMPVWATMLAWPVLGQRPTLRSASGLALCLVGISILFGGQHLQFDAGQITGVGLALTAALLFAVGTVALRPLAELGPLALLAWQLGLGCAPMVAIGVFHEMPQLARVTPTGWALMAYMTFVPMGLCYLTWFAALRRLPPATASIATLVTPVIGVCAAAIALDEPFGPRQIAAMVLTIGGVGLALRRTGADASAASARPRAPASGRARGAQDWARSRADCHG